MRIGLRGIATTGNVTGGVHGIYKFVEWLIGKLSDAEFVWSQVMTPDSQLHMVLKWLSDVPGWVPMVTLIVCTAFLYLSRNANGLNSKHVESESFDVRIANDKKDLETFFAYDISSGESKDGGSVSIYLGPKTSAKHEGVNADLRKTYRITARVTEVSYWNRGDYSFRGKKFWLLMKPKLYSKRNNSTRINIDYSHIGSFEFGWYPRNGKRGTFFLGAIPPKRPWLRTIRWRDTMRFVMFNVLIEAPYTSPANVRICVAYEPDDDKWRSWFGGVPIQ